MRTSKEPAPTLKKGLKTGSFTTIFYMFLCVNFRSLVMTMEGAEMMITKAMMKKRKKEEEGLVLVDAVVSTSLGKVSYHFSSSTAYNQYPCNTYFSEIGLLESTKIDFPVGSIERFHSLPIS